MGSGVLDTILIIEMIDSAETVNTEYFTESIDTSYRESEFSIQLTYDNGSTVDMDLSIEVSNDDLNFVEIPELVQNVTDNTGTDIWDIRGTGTNYLRVKIAVTTGSIDVQKVQYKAKRRH